jgi:hypothetical protein
MEAKTTLSQVSKKSRALPKVCSHCGKRMIDNWRRHHERKHEYSKEDLRKPILEWDKTSILKGDPWAADWLERIDNFTESNEKASKYSNYTESERGDIDESVYEDDNSVNGKISPINLLVNSS